MTVVTDIQRKDPSLAGWVAAKDAENAGGDENAQKMAGNSADWKTASPQDQMILHQQNTDIAKQTGQTYDKGTGTYSTPTTPKYAVNGAGSGGNPATNPAVTTSTTTGTTQPADNGIGNAQDYINQLNDLRKNASLSALQKSHDQSLSNMGAEKSAIEPKYYDQRNQVAAGAQQQARNFAEYMANRGGSSAGSNAQAELTRNIGTQGNLGALGQQEAAAYTDIERRTSDVNNAYQSDVATTTANAEADKMSALLDNYYKAQQRGDTLAQNQIQNAIAQSQLEIQKQTAAVNNQGQSLNNQLTQLKLTDYPAESQNAAKLVQQQLTAGTLSNEAATYNLAQLKDPNSPTNQAAKLDLQMKQIDASNYSQESKLKLQQLQKQIADIGVVHKTPQTADQIEYDHQQVVKIKAEIEKLNTPTPKTTDYKSSPEFSSDVAHLKASPGDAAMLDTNPQPFIDKYGYDGYLALRKEAGL